jgi:hypothetical protein
VLCFAVRLRNRNAVPDTDGQKNHVAACGAPVNGPMSTSSLYCKTGGVRAAFIVRSARNYAEFGGLQTLQK